MTNSRNDEHLSNYIRIHRRRSALTQRELAHALGYEDIGAVVCRHERFQGVPPLEIAIGYEIVFRTPVSELFAGLRDTMAVGIESRLAQLEESLGERTTRDKNASAIARKLMWLCERRNSETNFCHESQNSRD